MFQLINTMKPIILPLDEKSVELSSLYRQKVLSKEINDTLHIAISK